MLLLVIIPAATGGAIGAGTVGGLLAADG